MGASSHTLRYGTRRHEREVVRRWVLHDSVTTSSEKRAIILIHGGAWRDASNTCDDFVEFVRVWDEADGGFDVVYSIDYPLSSDLEGRYPAVVEGVLYALSVIHEDFQKLSTTDDASTMEYTLCGHSVGCTFITQVLEYEKYCSSRPPIMDYITRCVFLDGIYSIKELLDEYPDYAFFVEEEFGDLESALQKCNDVSSERTTLAGGMYRQMQDILLVHSTEDELLSLRQPRAFHAWLVDVCGVAPAAVRTVFAALGRHNDVYASAAVARLVLGLEALRARFTPSGNGNFCGGGSAPRSGVAKVRKSDGP